MSQRAEYVKHHDGEVVRIDNCTIGPESKSGLAVLVFIEDEKYWVPLSQVHKIERHKDVKGQDAIVVAAWWAKKEGLAE